MSVQMLLKIVAALGMGLHAAAAGDDPAGASRPPGRSGHMASVVGDKLLVAGGYSVGAGSQIRLDRWNPADGTWTALPPMPRGRSLGAMVRLGDRLYVIGGIGEDNSATADVECFDLVSATWEKPLVHDPLPSRVAAVSSGDEIFVIGGIENSGGEPDAVCSRKVISFNPHTAAWQARADLHTGRHGHAAAVFDGHIYVSGGYATDGQTASVEVYDPKTGQWRDGPALQRPHAFHGMAVVTGKLIAFGTRGNSEPIEILDPVSGKWIDGPPMPLNRNRFAWGVIGDRLYVIDGEDERGATPATIQAFDGRTMAWTVLEGPDHAPAGATTRGN